MVVEIDPKSGFCFGVVHAIRAAESSLSEADEVYCLGDIVHNNMEVERLKKMGLRIIDLDDFEMLKDKTVLIRAHGEPPGTYETARKNNIRIIDATCPIVLNLQRRIKNVYLDMENVDGQIVIFGKENHAEVIGLKGQAPDRVIVIGKIEDLDKIDFRKPVRFFAQTTQNHDQFLYLQQGIIDRMKQIDSDEEYDFMAFDSICRKVSNRADELSQFVMSYDVVVFAGDPKSSNGKYLFEVCKAYNPSTYLVSKVDDLQPEWFSGVARVGICGGTSTPLWLMEEIKKRIIAF